MTEDLDRARLDQMAEDLGGPEVVAEVISIFLEEAPRHLDALEGALAEGDADALRSAAHTLKSSSAQLGAMRVSELARKLEASGDAGKVAEAADDVGAARGAFEAAKRELEAVREEIT